MPGSIIWYWPMNSLWLGGVAVGCLTCDQQVVSSNPSLHVVGCNHGQVVSTHVALSAMVWYGIVGFNVPLDTV